VNYHSQLVLSGEHSAKPSARKFDGWKATATSAKLQLPTLRSHDAVYPPLIRISR